MIEPIHVRREGHEQKMFGEKSERRGIWIWKMSEPLIAFAT